MWLETRGVQNPFRTWAYLDTEVFMNVANKESVIRVETVEADAAKKEPM